MNAAVLIGFLVLVVLYLMQSWELYKVNSYLRKTVHPALRELYGLRRHGEYE